MKPSDETFNTHFGKEHDDENKKNEKLGIKMKD
jgi:hypothetical protein